MPAPVIAFLSDFGQCDTYVGCVKGALYKKSPHARIVDLTHQVPPQDVAAGAWLLRQSVPWMPHGTVVLAVVDPGVGTQRPMIAVKTDNYLAVAPDNGLLSWWLATETILEIRRLENKELWNDSVSATFHARDVMGPVAGFLCAGGKFEQVGATVQRLIELPKPYLQNDSGSIRGEVVYIDHFGNAITNIPVGIDANKRNELIKRTVTVDNVNVPMVSSYDSGQTNQLIGLIGSSGTLELAVKNGSAAELHGITRGKLVTLIL